MLRAAVTEYVDSSQAPRDTARRVADVSTWAQENAASVREVIRHCMTDPDAIFGSGCQFDEWLATVLGTNLEATKLRMGGLFDMTFAKPLAEVLEVTDEDLGDVWRRSAEIESLRRQGELFELAKSAHVLTIMFRGRYHDLVAREMGVQVLHHPVRTPLLPELSGAGGAPISHEVTNSERFMAQLLWASGFSERQHNSRIMLWAENVRLVRLAVQAEAIDLPHRSSEDRALETAVDAARRAGVRTHSRLMADCADAVIAMGLGALSSFVVDGWADMYVTLGTFIVSKKENLGERATRAAFENRRRLRQLADVPGRITVRFDNHADGEQG